MLYRDPVDKMIRSELDARSKLTNKQIEQMADEVLSSIPDERKERIEHNEEIDSKITELEMNRRVVAILECRRRALGGTRPLMQGIVT